MKNMFESREVFESYAMIDLCMYSLENLLDKVNSFDKLSPIDKEIYKVTGYYEDQMKNIYEESIEIAIQLIKYEKIIEKDNTETKKLLKHLKKSYKEFLDK